MGRTKKLDYTPHPRATQLHCPECFRLRNNARVWGHVTSKLNPPTGTLHKCLICGHEWEQKVPPKEKPKPVVTKIPHAP
jgi:hypothetical protein